MTKRTCIKCGHTGPPETDFPVSSIHKGKPIYRRKCKPCYSEQVSEWQKANDTLDRRTRKNKKTDEWRESKKAEGKYDEIWRKHFLKSKYGLTLEQYKAMLDAQQGVCAICGKPDPEEGKALAVDHNHATGTNRALLCGKCNKAIGLLNDSPTLLQAAIDYLTRWNHVTAPQSTEVPAYVN